MGSLLYSSSLFLAAKRLGTAVRGASSDSLEVYDYLEEAFLAVAAESLKEAQRRSHTKQWRDRVPLQRGHLRHYLCQLRPKSSTAGKGRAPCPDPAARR